MDGRVLTAPGHREAWDAYRLAGWIGIDQPAEWGGQELPLYMLVACQELFDRGSVGFGMAQPADGLIVQVPARQLGQQRLGPRE